MSKQESVNTASKVARQDQQSILNRTIYGSDRIPGELSHAPLAERYAQSRVIPEIHLNGGGVIGNILKVIEHLGDPRSEWVHEIQNDLSQHPDRIAERARDQLILENI